MFWAEMVVRLLKRADSRVRGGDGVGGEGSDRLGGKFVDMVVLSCGGSKG